MDIRKIRKLIELLDETGISEIEIKEGEESVRLSRHSHYVAPQAHYSPAAQQVPMAGAAQPSAAIPNQSPPSQGYAIRSPMVGTLYSAASPENPPFVTIGKVVKQGEVLCIIEAMKMFNEIEADRAGTITAIHVNNGEPVEYDQLLFTIE